MQNNWGNLLQTLYTTAALAEYIFCINLSRFVWLFLCQCLWIIQDFFCFGWKFCVLFVIYLSKLLLMSWKESLYSFCSPSFSFLSLFCSSLGCSGCNGGFFLRVLLCHTSSFSGLLLWILVVPCHIFIV